MRRAWHLLTGEYPPASGGVGAYTAVLAGALASAGEETHVWAPLGPDSPAPGGVELHAVDGFGSRGLARLGAELDGMPGPRTLLVQYAPRAFGLHGMNLGFCRWVAGRARAGDDVRVMFHEPFFPFGWQRPQRNALALVNRVMARVLLRAARVAYVSTPAWEALLRPYAPKRTRRMPWLPIPSTVPRVDDAVAVDAVRSRVTDGDADRPIVGHFGTYGGMIAPLLAPVVVRVLEDVPDARLLLLGDGGPGFAKELEGAHPSLAGRISAPGYLSPEAVSIHLQACDVAVQPYPDGASSRRTTLMAALANGVVAVTNTGRFTEDLWSSTRLQIASDAEPGGLSPRVIELLRDAKLRAEVAEAGRELYARHFAVEHTVRTLLGGGEGSLADEGSEVGSKQATPGEAGA